LSIVLCYIHSGKNNKILKKMYQCLYLAPLNFCFRAAASAAATELSLSLSLSFSLSLAAEINLTSKSDIAGVRVRPPMLMQWEEEGKKEGRKNPQDG
jgi:hypothetical protein